MKLINSQADLETFCKQKFPAFITVDTEFMREHTYYPKLCLIQIGAPDIEPVAIDPLAKGINLDPLLKILANKKVLKVFHAGKQDFEIFYALMDGKLPSPVFDTQIAAAVLGYGDQVGYASLVKRITGSDVDKSRQFTNWAKRPLSDKQIDYALGDVTFLIDVYKKLQKDLDKKERNNWIKEEMDILTDPSNYRTEPMDAWKKVKMRSYKKEDYVVLQSLAAWREEVAMEKDIPKQRVIRDDALAQMAMIKPKEVEQLSRIRNFPKPLQAPPKAKQLFQLINDARKNYEDSAIKPPKAFKKSSTDITPITDMLKLLLKINCSEHGLAGKIIASSSDIEHFALGDMDVPFMKGWRYKIYGQDAENLSKGKLSLSLRNGTIQKI